MPSPALIFDANNTLGVALIGEVTLAIILPFTERISRDCTIRIVSITHLIRVLLAHQFR